jgi:hypothetical protein
MIKERNLSSNLIARLGWVDNPWERILYVWSTHSKAVDANNSGLSKDRPLKTLARAMVIARANDLIVVGARHAETIVAAVGLTSAQARVKIIGIGTGNDRPKVTFSTSTAAQIDIDAPGVRIENMIFSCAVDGQLIMLDVNSDACHLRKCRFEDSSSYQPVTTIDMATAADNGIIEECEFAQENAGATQAILLGATCNDIKILNNDCVGDFSAAIIKGGAGTLRLLIEGNKLTNLNAVDKNIDLAATATGWIVNNRCGIDTADVKTWITAAACMLGENYGSNQLGETGMVIGTVSV